MLSRQAERHEKCPVVDCEYHTIGFYRECDKIEHTLEHYTGIIVCSFCARSEIGQTIPVGFGLVAGFKTHLITIHGVERTSLRGKKLESSKQFTHGKTSGTCSNCEINFESAQALYEHLDACIIQSIHEDSQKGTHTHCSEEEPHISQPSSHVQSHAVQGGSANTVFEQPAFYDADNYIPLSYDCQPPILSSTSDSGASCQGTQIAPDFFFGDVLDEYLAMKMSLSSEGQDRKRSHSKAFSTSRDESIVSSSSKRRKNSDGSEALRADISPTDSSSTTAVGKAENTTLSEPSALELLLERWVTGGACTVLSRVEGGDAK